MNVFTRLFGSRLKPIIDAAEKAAAAAKDRPSNGIKTSFVDEGQLTLTMFLADVDQCWVNYNAEQLDEMISALHEARDRLSPPFKPKLD